MINRYSSLNIYLYPLDMPFHFLWLFYCFYICWQSQILEEISEAPKISEKVFVLLYEINIVNDKYYTMNTTILYSI